MQSIYAYSLTSPVAHITNFSDGIPTVIEITNILNNLPDSWTCKMVEKHHVNKKDKPIIKVLILEEIFWTISDVFEGLCKAK